MGVNGYVSRRQNGTTGYLFKDAHGDVLSIYTSTSNKAADYTYDAWGEIKKRNIRLYKRTDIWRSSNLTTVISSIFNQDSKAQSVADLNALIDFSNIL